MNVNLGPHFEAMIRRKVESGRYTNASEVVREALRTMEDRDRASRLRAAVAIGEADAAAGRVYDWTEESMDEARAADEAGLPIEPDVLP